MSRKKLEKALEKLGVKITTHVAIDKTETLEIGSVTFSGKKLVRHIPVRPLRRKTKPAPESEKPE